LARCDGAHELDELVANVPGARELLADLAGERVLVEGGPEDRPAAPATGFAVEGSGVLADALRARLPAGNDVHVVAQDDLDLRAALAACARRRSDGTRVVWASIGPLARAYVGPL